MRWLALTGLVFAVGCSGSSANETRLLRDEYNTEELRLVQMQATADEFSKKMVLCEAAIQEAKGLMKDGGVPEKNKEELRTSMWDMEIQLKSHGAKLSEMRRQISEQIVVTDRAKDKLASAEKRER